MILYKKSIALFIGLSYAISYGQGAQRPLNILFVVGHFPAPSQTFILNIITGLIDKGHNVSIFSFHKDEPLHLHPNIIKYKLMKRVIYKKFPLKLSKCDIVFCQFGGIGKKILGNSDLSRWLKKRKTIVCFRGSDITARLHQNIKAYKKMFHKGDFFLPVCDYFRKKLISLGCSARKVAVYYSAIDCSKFFFTARQKPANGVINVVSVCRLVKKKGIDYAIKAFADVVKQYPQIHYTIVGDGAERSYLELLIYQLNLQDNVTLYGWKNQNEIVSILNESHIFLLPSRRAPDGNEEGIANALKEAMAMGLISVATFHAGTPELIENGVSGFLVAEQTVAELASTIKYIIEHSEIWESVGLAARKKVEDEFETRRSIEKLEEIFYDVLHFNRVEKSINYRGDVNGIGQ